MPELSGFPYFEVEFRKDGTIFDQNQVQQVTEGVRSRGISDLFVISHGWNNDRSEARDLYARFFSQVRSALNAGTIPGASGRTYGVVGVFWPSKKFAESELIPGGGAASIGGGIGEAAIIARLEDLKGVFDAPGADDHLEEAKALVPRLEDSPAARDKFVDLIRKLFPESDETEEKIPPKFFEEQGRNIIEDLGTPLAVEMAAHAGGGSGAAAMGVGMPGAGTFEGAAGLGDVFNKIRTGVQNILNFTTYYQMKERAGTVGRNGVNRMLRALRAAHPGLKLHLIGHSFGGRLVTAAADGPGNEPPVKIDSMMLLQAAFSHNGFSGNYDGHGAAGFFRTVVAGGKVAGPILISHSSFDKAVGIAYPLAGRIVRDAAAALGDANDKFGGMGRNGAQKTAEAIFGDLLPVAGTYTFQPGRIYNLKAENYIKDHSDICKREVAHALLCAVGGT